MTQAQTIELINSMDRAIFSLMLIGVMLALVLTWKRNTKLKFSPLLLILAVGLILRVSRLSESFWYDETFAGVFSRIPLTHFGAATIADVHPPLYNLLLHITRALIGESDINLRLPSLVFGISSIYMMYKISHQMTKRADVALVAALIVALLPAHIRYSAEARVYMLLTLVVQIGVYGVLIQRRSLVMIAIALLPLLHNYGYLYAGVVLVAGWNWSIIPSLLPGAIWLPFMIYQSGDIADGFWLAPLTLQGVIRPLVTMSIKTTDAYVIFISIPLLFSLFFIGVFPLWGAMDKRARLIWSMVIAGVPAVAALVSFVWHPIYLDRGLMPAVTLAMVAVAAAVIALPMARIATIVCIGVALISYQLSGARDDIRSPLLHCSGDSVYTVSTSTAIIARWYTDKNVFIMAGANDLAQTLPDNVKATMGITPISSHWQLDSFCMPVQDSPYNWTRQNIAEVERVLMRRHSMSVWTDNPIERFIIYEVDNELR